MKKICIVFYSFLYMIVQSSSIEAKPELHKIKETVNKIVSFVNDDSFQCNELKEIINSDYCINPKKIVSDVEYSTILKSNFNGVWKPKKLYPNIFSDDIFENLNNQDIFFVNVFLNISSKYNILSDEINELLYEYDYPSEVSFNIAESKFHSYDISFDALIKKIKKLAAQGEKNSLYKLAYYTEIGKEIEPNQELAWKLYHLASSQGNLLATYHIAYAQILGDLGLDHNPITGWEKMNKLISMNYDKAMCFENAMNANFKLQN